MEKLLNSPLWEHQREAVKRFKDWDEIALFFEPGCGKTRCTIEILRHKFLGGLRPTLIICPLAVCENWRRELLQYSEILDDQIVLLIGDKKVSKLRDRKSDNQIFITNFESFISAPFLGFVHQLMKTGNGVVVVDESQKIKNIQSKRTKAILKLGTLVKTRFILTGTPVLNTPLDIYTQFKFLNNGQSFPDAMGNPMNFYAFRATFMEDKNSTMPKFKYFPNWKIRPNALNVLNEKILDVSMRVEKKDCLDLPELVRSTRYVELEGEARRLYQDMKRDFIAYMGDRACVATLAIVKALRLLQITNGFITFEGGVTQPLACPKMDALHELLEDLTPHHKVIVWAVFRENYRGIAQVCDKLKIKYVFLHGEVTQKERVDNMDAFQKDDHVRVLIGNPNAGGIGVNLVAASYSIYFSRNFSLEADIQSEARNYRGGSEIHDRITRIDLVANNTLDETVMTALARKQDISMGMLRTWGDRERLV